MWLILRRVDRAAARLVPESYQWNERGLLPESCLSLADSVVGPGLSAADYGRCVRSSLRTPGHSRVDIVERLAEDTYVMRAFETKCSSRTKQHTGCLFCHKTAVNAGTTGMHSVNAAAQDLLHLDNGIPAVASMARAFTPAD